MPTQISKTASNSDSQHYQAVFEALVLQRGSVARAVAREVEAGTPPARVRQHVLGKCSLIVGDDARTRSGGADATELTLQRAGVEMSENPLAHILARDSVLKDELNYLDEVGRPEAVQSSQVIEYLQGRRQFVEAARADLISMARMYIEQGTLRRALAGLSDNDPSFQSDMRAAAARAADDGDRFVQDVKNGASLGSAMAAAVVLERSEPRTDSLPESMVSTPDPVVAPVAAAVRR